MKFKGSVHRLAVRKEALGVFALVLGGFLSGCSATSTFTAYPTKIKPAIAGIEKREEIDLDTCLAEECKSKDRILYSMERGRIAQVAGKPDFSMGEFRTAIEKIRENEQKPIVSASEVGANLAAVAVNDNALPYEGKGYERVMLHHYQAMNYLIKKDLEGAGVEVRWANQQQEEALRRHEKEVEKARKDAEEKEVADPWENSDLSAKYALMDEVAGKVKNSFQNAYTFYVSGVIWELMGQPNDAYIDYKKALEIYGENRYLRGDVLRLARVLGMEEDLAVLQADAPVADSVPGKAPGAGELIVFFEDGFVPQREEVKIPIPIPTAGLTAIAFPIYNTPYAPPSPLRVNRAEEPLGTTESICDVRALAVKSLKEEAPALAIRQIIRATVKGAAAKVAKEKLGDLGSLAMSAWNLLSENADLRSWITLPANAQILRMPLPAGAHELHLQHEGTPASADVRIDVGEGGKTILYVVRAGDQLYSSALTF